MALLAFRILVKAGLQNAIEVDSNGEKASESQGIYDSQDYSSVHAQVRLPTQKITRIKWKL